MRLAIATMIGVLLTAAAGLSLCKAVGWNASPAALAIGGGVFFVGASIGQIPLILTRGADQAAVTQAGLLATLAHMFVGLAAAAIVIFSGAKFAPQFVCWAFAFYVVTLCILVAEIIRAVKSATIYQAK